MYVLILKNLYMILKNMYIWFEEYGIRYVCTYYIWFEKYGASTGMNNDRWMLMDGRGRTDGIGTEQTYPGGWNQTSETRQIDVEWMVLDVRRKSIDIDCNGRQTNVNYDGHRTNIEQKLMDIDCDDWQLQQHDNHNVRRKLYNNGVQRRRMSL
jgi:hypothetical protein